MTPSAKRSTTTKRWRRKAAEIIQGEEPVYRGSLIQYSRRCGSTTCKCAEGRLHQGWALSVSVEGKTQVVYISDELRPEVAAGIERHKELCKLIERISKAETEKLRRHARRYNKR